MNFAIKPKNTEVIGTTEKGNSIRYTIVPQEKIKTWQPDSSVNPRTLSINELSKKEINRMAVYMDNMGKATRIVVKSSFKITSPMIDLIEQSKILTVEHRSSSDQNYFVFIPHPLFNYEKLNEVLFDLTQKFDL